MARVHVEEKCPVQVQRIPVRMVNAPVEDLPLVQGLQTLVQMLPALVEELRPVQGPRIPVPLERVHVVEPHLAQVIRIRVRQVYVRVGVPLLVEQQIPFQISVQAVRVNVGRLPNVRQGMFYQHV